MEEICLFTETDLCSDKNDWKGKVLSPLFTLDTLSSPPGGVSLTADVFLKVDFNKYANILIGY